MILPVPPPLVPLVILKFFSIFLQPFNIESKRFLKLFKQIHALHSTLFGNDELFCGCLSEKRI
ncbi:hypothetical protein DERP_005228 [Dermatophagoides pteronyssinus]|uniref:Uncharacterized protein n=1 Tax=Dermatophagoides pteronyssinus TaxID=6956 RepID=A0ABQ8JML1_DERPT|nr:hypothetical protein DERP_005228 [Dermatophagoides pteronyssinus]